MDHKMINSNEFLRVYKKKSIITKQDSTSVMQVREWGLNKLHNFDHPQKNHDMTFGNK